MTLSKNPIGLIIMDGYGLGNPSDLSNAVTASGTPNLSALAAAYPCTALETAGEFVGLPEGQMGNSEVGHLNIGAGRIVYQELTRISKDIREGRFAQHPVLQKAMQTAKEKGKALHLLGLLSDGGVHSHITHLYALLSMAKKMELDRVYIHAILDGRDVPPTSGREYLEQLQHKLAEIGVGEIATISGRYYAMDRDQRWERVQKAYDALVMRKGITAAHAQEAMQMAADRGETDEFVLPTVIGGVRGNVDAEDTVLFFNFRPDRARQITQSFVLPDFEGFAREKGFFSLHFVTMTQYKQGLPVQVAYPPQTLENTMGDVYSQLGLKQLRIAETEKYAHVTYFLNGGREKTLAGEERILIPSPKVATYDLQPTMSAEPVTQTLVDKIHQQAAQLYVVNFANCDMVGHTGKLEAAMQAVACVDEKVGQVVKALLEQGGSVIVTADHGNAEQMIDPLTGQPHTAHTTNLVPLILAGETFVNRSLRPGVLADIAPTILTMAGIELPKEMTGQCLLV